MKTSIALCACAVVGSAVPAWAQETIPQTPQQAETVRIATEISTRVAKEIATQISAEVAAQVAKQVAAQLASQAASGAVGQQPVQVPSAAPAPAPNPDVPQDKGAQRLKAADDGKYKSRFYGLLDLGLEHLNNEVTAGKSYSSNRVSAGTATPYLGYIHYQPLRGNLVGVMNLEGGFAGDNGTSSLGTRLFGRATYVGVISDYGSLTFGRQYTMRFWAVQAVNPLGVGSHGLPTLDNGISNARADNSVSYRIQHGKWDFGVNYSFGRDAVSTNSIVGTNCAGETAPSTQCRERSAMLKYGDKKWGISSAYEENLGGTAATFGNLTSPDKKDSRAILGAWYRTAGDTLLTIGWIRRDADTYAPNPVSKLLWVGTSVPVTRALSLDGMVGNIKYDGSNNGASMIALRGVYALDDENKMATYLTADYVNNRGRSTFGATTATPAIAPQAGGSQLSVIAGVRLRF
jgi:predicted porin